MAGGNVPAQLAPIFKAAGQQYKIPPEVLAGVASVETNLGANRSTSSTGAVGLMQFEPGTAHSVGINPLDDRQAIFGAAKLLNEYGYQQNPTRAIGAYNGGPGNPQYGYAQQVLSEASRLKSQLGGSAPGAASTGLPIPQAQPQSQLDQAGFKQAQQRYVLGQFLKEQKTGPFGSSTSGLEPLFKLGVIPTSPPNQADFTRTVQAAHNTLQQIAGSAPLNVHPSTVPGYKGYVNPISGFTVGRTDMGVDANARPGTPIRAIGDSQVVAIRPNWYQGQPYVQLKLLNGPQAGKFYYVAEQITPAVKPGQVLHAGDPIGSYANQGTGIEIGWGSPDWRTLAQATTGYHEGQVTPAGQSFRNLLGTLGA